jgi:alkaline phosphatase
LGKNYRIKKGEIMKIAKTLPTVKLIAIFLILFFNSCSDSQKAPKNLIILIGDGMGLSQVSVSLLADPQSHFKDFPYTGLSITRSTSDLITDSGAGGTAISCGVRTYNGAIGVGPDSQKVESIFDFLRKKGYSLGVVATSSITHATPAVFYAHAKSRKEEFFIADELLEKGLDVAIGGGIKFFRNQENGGARQDKDLITEMEKANYKSYFSIEELNSYDKNKKILGLLSFEGLPKAKDRDYSLADLTKIAIERLSTNRNGFALMIEGSQIDWACHQNDPDYLLGELKDFEDAIAVAIDFAKRDGNTLVVVLADHETGGFSIVDGNPDGSEMKFSFTSSNHTPVCIPVFSFGPRANEFVGVMQNYEIGQKFFSIFSGY